MSWLFVVSHWRAAILAALIFALVLALGLWRAEAARMERLQGALATAQAGQASAQGQAKAARAAGATVAAGAARDARTQSLHQDHQHAIEVTPGSGQGLDPALNDAGRRGLCAYRAYGDDPACLQLLGPRSSQRQGADPSDAPPAD